MKIIKYLLSIVIIYILFLSVDVRALEKSATGYIESPTGTMTGETIEISGWTMSTIESDVEVYLDNNKIDIERVEREDVLRVIKGYGTIDENPTPGYKSTYNVRDIKDGSHKLKVYIKEKSTGTIISTIEKVFNLKKYLGAAFIDTPNGNMAGKIIPISGWVMSTDANAKIRVLIDGIEISNINRTERNDVLRVIKGYGDESINKTPGYMTTYDASNMTDGNHRISVQLIANTGEILASIERNFLLEKYKATGYIETPSGNVTGTELRVSGWAMSSVENIVSVKIDGKEVNDIERIERKDVIRAIKNYGSEEINITPGYNGVFDASDLKDGNHKISLTIIEKETEKILHVMEKNFSLKKYVGTGCIDIPTGKIVGKKIVVAGWAMSTDADAEIKLTIDGQKINDIERVERKDVIKAITNYGSEEINKTPGYKATYDASNLNDGNHKVIMELISKKTGEVLTRIERSFSLEKYKAVSFIDTPTGKVNGNNILISGWAMSSVENDVVITIDNEEVKDIERTERNDVIKSVTNYGTIDVNVTPGYKATYDASSLNDGNHKVKVVVKEKLTGKILHSLEQSFSLKKYTAKGFIDTPSGTITGTTIDFSGWIMSTDENAKLKVLIDNEEIKSIERIERQDVIRNVTGYGTIKENPTPGFKGSYDGIDLKDGTHNITIIVTDKETGETLYSQTQKFNLKKYLGKIYIDEPTSSMFTKTVKFIGWEMSQTAGSTINVYIDGVQQNPEIIRTLRNDVIRNVSGYGTTKENPTPGFEISINLANIVNGKHTVKLDLMSRRGDILDTAVKDIYVYNNLDLGIDVSSHNGTIDWGTVKINGINFAMIRVGYRGYGDAGTIRKDGYFDSNIVNANKAGIKTGVYFFSQARNYAEGVEEANMTIEYIANYRNLINMPVVIDTEYSTEPSHNGRADNLSKGERTEAILGFCRRIAEAGYTPMIYASRDWLYNNLDMSVLNDYQVWLAHYTESIDNRSNYKGIYSIWQYTSKATISGMNGFVDRNVLFS